MRRYRIMEAAPQFAGFTATRLYTGYNAPPQWTGKGTVVGLLEFGSSYKDTDVQTHAQVMGLPPVDIALVDVAGAPDDQGGSAYDMEGTLDVEILHVGAPNARIIYFLLPMPQDYPTFGQLLVQGLQEVLNYSATVQHIDAVSISYGEAECRFTPEEMQQANALIGQLLQGNTITGIATGDQGDYGSHEPGLPLVPRVDWPASCPNALAIGGTTLSLGPPRSEIVWFGDGATGGGFSDLFPRPPYQDKAHQTPMRGIPDFSLVANPIPGFSVFFEGVWTTVGGTSGSCPLGIGFLMRALEARRAVGLPDWGASIQQTLYDHPEAFHDITWGYNGYGGVTGLPAGPGWDPCTGLGTPDVCKLIEVCTEGKVVPVSQGSVTVPVYVNGQKQPAIVAYLDLKPGDALVPVDLVAEAMGAKATRDAYGVYITTAQKQAAAPA